MLVRARVHVHAVVARVLVHVERTGLVHALLLLAGASAEASGLHAASRARSGDSATAIATATSGSSRRIESSSVRISPRRPSATILGRVLREHGSRVPREPAPDSSVARASSAFELAHRDRLSSAESVRTDTTARQVVRVGGALRRYHRQVPRPLRSRLGLRRPRSASRSASERLGHLDLGLESRCLSLDIRLARPHRTRARRRPRARSSCGPGSGSVASASASRLGSPLRRRPRPRAPAPPRQGRLGSGSGIIGRRLEHFVQRGVGFGRRGCRRRAAGGR